MHSDRLGNTPQCIQEMIKKRQLEEELETLEDRLLTIGICPLMDCQKLHAALTNTMDTDKQTGELKAHVNLLKVMPSQVFLRIGAGPFGARSSVKSTIT
ncbi:hypothetical protein AVEN_47708-1 [Araneus ventricosus]|uniref:Uncharacterized protein n=1 Tax=Araneus ventricosus TaxID=182803 RepID=A0A4Y2P0Z2_ARAVE|nr:hypothetical protein AVEN_98741-1 [Araneus ventricosus]GBN44689.1 hypothetical protein AVEN_47708-1 [Araneus ventricosus]